MTVNLTLQVPEDAFSITRSSREEFAQEVLITAAVKWYEMGKISQSKASELTGLSRYEFLMALNKYGVSPFHETYEELVELLESERNKHDVGN